jgi:hypothetical protein
MEKISQEDSASEMAYLEEELNALLWHFEGDNEVRLLPIIHGIVHRTNL